MSTNIFLQATRTRLRFPSVVGLLTVEDVWDLPLTTQSASKPSIENIGSALLARQAAFQNGSILRAPTRTKEQTEVDLAVEVIRTIAQIRQDEADAKTLAAARSSERERLKAIIAEREVKEASVDDLKARLAALGG